MDDLHAQMQRGFCPVDVGGRFGRTTNICRGLAIGARAVFRILPGFSTARLPSNLILALFPLQSIHPLRAVCEVSAPPERFDFEKARRRTQRMFGDQERSLGPTTGHAQHRLDPSFIPA